MNPASPTAQAPSRRTRRDAGPIPGPRVAYIMSRFPKISETFVLYEMKAMEEMGAGVEVFPLLRQPPGKRHPEALRYERRAHFVPFFSFEGLRSNAKRFLRNPRLYCKTWWDALRGTFGSAKFFLGALVYFPKCVVFAERMEALGVDHIHAHFANHPALAAWIVHRLTEIPYSFTAHGSDLHVDRRMLAEKVARSSFVVTISAYNRDLIAEECGRGALEKVVVIHCGTDPSEFGDPGSTGPDHARLPTRWPSGPLRIVCVASLEEVKGHRFLLQACRMLIERGVEVHCDLVGGGPLRRRLERLSRQLGLEGWVIFHGPLPRPDVRRFLQKADVAVLASHPTRSGKREGIPVALMEAMMSGLPVVASSISGIPELVDDEQTGFLVPSGEPGRLAHRLERLATDPLLRRQLGAAGRAKVKREFDLRTGARLLLSHIESSRVRTAKKSPTR